jgi:hypothetical protein
MNTAVSPPLHSHQVRGALRIRAYRADQEQAEQHRADRRVDRRLAQPAGEGLAGQAVLLLPPPAGIDRPGQAQHAVDQQIDDADHQADQPPAAACAAQPTAQPSPVRRCARSGTRPGPRPGNPTAAASGRPGCRPWPWRGPRAAVAPDRRPWPRPDRIEPRIPPMNFTSLAASQTSGLPVRLNLGQVRPVGLPATLASGGGARAV